MAYTEIDKSSDFFNTVLYTGTGGSHAISGVGFAPNWVWIKSISTVQNNLVYDTIRGATKTIRPNTDDPENTEAEFLKSFGSDGFTLGTRSEPNESGETFVSWNWKAETAFSNDASSTGIGSIDSSGTANDTAGFSIVSYTGSGSAATVKHGLSTTPNMMIIKNRPTSTKDWQVYSPVNDPTDALALNQTDATGDSDVYWNDTAPTSSVFSVKSGATNTDGAATIGYIFSNRQGFSKFATYTGSGSVNGPVIFTGFSPALVILKRTNSSNHWIMFDNKRDPHNEAIGTLYPSQSVVEDRGTGANDIDFLANGFKIREDNGECNGDGDSYIYMAFAQQPFVTSTGVPATAR